MSRIHAGKMDGKVALVTGAGSGIGKAAALRLAREGAKVALFGRRPGPIEEAAAEIRAGGGDALAISVDVGDLDAYVRAINEVHAHFGRLDALVNNAMVEGPKSIMDLSLADWHDAFRVNVDAVFVSTREAFKLMSQTGGGSVVNISSTCGMKALENMAAYSASKAALQHFSAVAAMESPAYNVRVNCIVPGFVATEALVGYAGGDQNVLDAIGRGVPMGRLGRPEELAAAILFLCSDDSSYVNGAALPVDGGHLMRINTATPG